MSVKFTVKMTEKYMYDFFLYNAYTSISGLLGPILGVVALMMAINSYLDAGVTAAMPGLLVAILFLVISPIQLKSRAKMQAQQSEMFKKPLEYEFNETGVVVRQDDLEAVNEWGDFAKAVSTQKSVILYLNRVRALIFPKECMGEQYEEVMKMIHTHMPPSKVKIRHIH